MHNDVVQNKRGLSLSAFIYLTSTGFLVAGAATAALAATNHLSSSAAFAAVVALAGALGLAIPRALSRNPARAQSLVAALRSPTYQYGSCFAVVALATILLVTAPETDIVLALSAILIWFWLFGVAALLYFRPAWTRPEALAQETVGGSRRLASVFGLLLAIAIALLPSKIPGLLDGIPWDTPVEFIFVGILLPVAFLVGRRTFGHRSVLAGLAVLLMIKIASMTALPQSGLGVRAYTSESAMSGGQWQRSYYSLLAPAYTQVIQAPYLSFREFPIEWTNAPGFQPESFWLGLKVSGVAHLADKEKLVFFVQGARDTQIVLQDAVRRTELPALVISNLKQLKASTYQQLDQPAQLIVNGILVFTKLGQFRFDPLLLSPDGSSRSALQAARIWVDPSGPNYAPSLVTAFQDVIDLVSVLLICIVSAALVVGVVDLLRAGTITPFDLYLGATALPVLYLAGLVPKPQINLLALVVVGLLGAVKIAEVAIYPQKPSTRSLVLSIGLAFLLVFAALELDVLRSVVFLPPAQDGQEYQYLARRIFVEGDLFLGQTPPRAYKVLFPYVVGGLHALFGQSASAQLFLNAWSALLGSMILAWLMRPVVSAALSVGAAVFYLLILCLPSTYVYYFRFGLIEPLAVLLLLVACYFGSRRQRLGMFAAGLLTVLLRLDYLGAALCAVVLTADPIRGNVSAAWQLLLAWIRTQWKLAIAYACFLCAPPALIILGYTLFARNYMLSALDTHQTSLASMADGLLQIVAGGNMPQLRAKAAEDPSYIALVALPLVLGFVIALAALVWRRGVLAQIDLRFALLVPAILPTYMVVRPTGYLPRFSLPLLPFDLIVIGLLVYLFVMRRRSANQ